MREGWNFHNDIAIPLELYARRAIGESYACAGDIESGEFVDTMLSVLSVLYDLKAIPEFADSCRAYSGIPGAEIPPEVCCQLFTDFKLLVKNSPNWTMDGGYVYDE